MKYIRLTVISIFVVFVLFFAFKKPEGYEIAGKWYAGKIVLNGKTVHSDTSKKFSYVYEPNVQILTSTKEILFFLGDSAIKANFELEKINGKKQLILSSREKALNGIFEMEIDSVLKNPRDLQIEVRLRSGKTFLQFGKKVHIDNFNPQFPRKGAV
ncbi:hypothetical protein [Flavobacterium sp.]|uniref:hypothetical protein n=1 Tax=Flavobacterium sp. TaxID=239 RepID=UPI001222ACFE|nr:hypothetical protein [Flavobacterium sp.]RZJ70365.1 MAG: hypothetical protein EOO49_13870 [Flavobacterium sp.]